MTDTYSRRDLIALTAVLVATSSAAQACIDSEGNSSPGVRDAESAEPAGGSELTQVSQLIGKKLRLIRPNQPVTMDYSDSRVNIEVDESGTILRVAIG